MFFQTLTTWLACFKSEEKGCDHVFSEDFWVEDQYQEKPTREECCICNGELESVQTIIEARPTGEYGRNRDVGAIAQSVGQVWKSCVNGVST